QIRYQTEALRLRRSPSVACQSRIVMTLGVQNPNPTASNPQILNRSDDQALSHHIFNHAAFIR
ncbi:hypothetical protein ACO0K2_18845, partial [Undibacterium sp. MH2W]|uniref:hypothetical protein n=1 Tax=Undibacterium sp. MH2W TaxID=3413044 RepID=UPI003BF0ED9E